MRVRIDWLNKVDFPDLQSFEEGFWEAGSLEDALGQCLNRVALHVIGVMHREEIIPRMYHLDFAIEVYDAHGDPVQATNPKAVYEALKAGSSFLLAPRGMEVPYNGKRQSIGQRSHEARGSKVLHSGATGKTSAEGQGKVDSPQHGR